MERGIGDTYYNCHLSLIDDSILNIYCSSTNASFVCIDHLVKWTNEQMLNILKFGYTRHGTKDT